MGLIPAVALFVMLPVIYGLNQLGWHAAAQVPFWIGPILLFVLLPLLDLRFGPDGQNPPDEVMEALEADKHYRRCIYLYLPFQYASVILGAYLFTASDLSWLGFDGALGWPAKIGLSPSTPLTNWATRGKRWSAGCPRSHSPRPATATSTSSTTAATTFGWLPRRTPPRPGSANRFGPSCRAACGAG
jgi:hypothetical protein